MSRPEGVAAPRPAGRATARLAGAELSRAARSLPVRGGAVVALVVAVGAGVVVGGAPEPAGVADLLDGLRVAAPLAAAALAGLVVGGWWSAGSAAVVCLSTPRRAPVPAVEVAVAAVVAAGVATAGWVGAAGAVAVRDSVAAAAAGPAAGWLLAAAGRVAVATAVAGALGGALGWLCRSGAGALLVVAGAYLFVEPVAGGAARSRLGPGAGAWVEPVTSAVQLAGAPALAGGPARGPATAALVVLGWAIALVTAGTVWFVRADLR